MGVSLWKQFELKMSTKKVLIFCLLVAIFEGCIAGPTDDMKWITEPDELTLDPAPRFLMKEAISRAECKDIDDIKCMVPYGPKELIAQAKGVCCYRSRVCGYVNGIYLCRYLRQCVYCA